MGPARRHNHRPRPMPRVRPVINPVVLHVIRLLRPANPGGLHPHAGGVIRRPKAYRPQPRRGCSNRLHMRNPGSRFDDYLKLDGLFPPHRAFNCRHQSIDGLDICGTSDLRDYDGVQAFAALFLKVYRVAIPERRIQRVDPDRQ